MADRPESDAQARYREHLANRERMSHDDLNTLRSLLIRYASIELDQFESWKVETPYGPVYIDLSRRPMEGASPDIYLWMTEFPDDKTGM